MPTALIYTSPISRRTNRGPRVWVNAPRGCTNPQSLTGDNILKVALGEFNKAIGRSRWSKEYNTAKEVLKRISMSRPSRGSKRGRVVNPVDVKLERAMDVSQRWHGRPTREVLELVEEEKYNDTGVVLGFLVELGVLDPRGDGVSKVIPIKFKYVDDLKLGLEDTHTVKVVSNLDENNIEFVDGDQAIDLDDVEWVSDGSRAKDKVCLGKVMSISYFTDKHHLEGPKSQRYGTEYEHEFAEELGKGIEDRIEGLPELVYDQVNERLMLVGGVYKITELGIQN